MEDPHHGSQARPVFRYGRGLISQLTLPAKAGLGVGAFSPPASLAQASPVEKAQFVWGGRRYCWYNSAWRGPGWYQCGFAWRRGLGWGGAAGWHGWRHPGFVHRPIHRPPVHRPPVTAHLFTAHLFIGRRLIVPVPTDRVMGRTDPVTATIARPPIAPPAAARAAEPIRGGALPFPPDHAGGPPSLPSPLPGEAARRDGGRRLAQIRLTDPSSRTSGSKSGEATRRPRAGAPPGSPRPHSRVARRASFEALSLLAAQQKTRMKTLKIGDITITSLIERDGPWRTPEAMFPAYEPSRAQASGRARPRRVRSRERQDGHHLPDLPRPHAQAHGADRHLHRRGQGLSRPLTISPSSPGSTISTPRACAWKTSLTCSARICISIIPAGTRCFAMAGGRRPSRMRNISFTKDEYAIGRRWRRGANRPRRCSRRPAGKLVELQLPSGRRGGTGAAGRRHLSARPHFHSRSDAWSLAMPLLRRYPLARPSRDRDGRPHASCAAMPGAGLVDDLRL